MQWVYKLGLKSLRLLCDFYANSWSPNTRNVWTYTNSLSKCKTQKQKAKSKSRASPTELQVYLQWAHMGVSSGYGWYTSLVIPGATLELITIIRLVFLLSSWLLHFLKFKKNKEEFTIVEKVKHFDDRPALFSWTTSTFTSRIQNSMKYQFYCQRYCLNIWQCASATYSIKSRNTLKHKKTTTTTTTTTKQE